MARLVALFLILITNITTFPVLVLTAVRTQEYRALLIDNSGGVGSSVLSGHLETWAEESPVGCAIRCSLKAECVGFLWDSSGTEYGDNYNNSSAQCTTGSMVKEDYSTWTNSSSSSYHNNSSSSSDSIGSDSIKLYLSSGSAGGGGTCRYDLGYELRTLPDGSVRCVYLSSDGAVPWDAEAACQSHGGRLFKTDNFYMIGLVITMADERAATGAALTENVHIGLEYVLAEDRFVWSDGSVMTAEEGEQLFVIPPSGGQEQCMSAWRSMASLLSSPCNGRYSFMCEMGDYV